MTDAGNPLRVVRLALGLLPAVCGTGSAQGLWEGTPYSPPSARPPPPAAAATKWLVLDTGGSGGGFGKGDIRQKLQDVHLWDDRVGWACGYGGVFMTGDGGLTWTRMKPKGGWYHLEMTGPRDIWLLEGFHGQGKARLWHTADAGDEWHEAMAGQLRGYADLYCRGDQRWILCGDFRSYRSRDGGETWQREAFGGALHGANRIAVPADVPTPDGFAVYAFGHHHRKARMVKSSDRGGTWQVVTLPDSATTSHWPCRLFFVTSRTGWLGLRDGKVFFTADGGQNWEARPLPTKQRVSALWFDQLGRGFAAVNNTDFMHFQQTLYESQDAGRTWTAVLGGAKHVSALFGRGPRRVWGVGDVPGFIQNDLVVILGR